MMLNSGYYVYGNKNCHKIFNFSKSSELYNKMQWVYVTKLETSDYLEPYLLTYSMEQSPS